MMELFILMAFTLILASIAIVLLAAVMVISHIQGRRVNIAAEHNEIERQKELEWANLLSYNGTKQGGELE